MHRSFFIVLRGCTDPFSLFYVDALQEWLKMPTAILYADGQKSGPSA
jgi:hypothetical protein